MPVHFGKNRLTDYGRLAEERARLRSHGLIQHLRTALEYSAVATRKPS